jgi:hypothetical protein
MKKINKTYLYGEWTDSQTKSQPDQHSDGCFFAELIVNEKINEGMNALLSELISFKAKCSNSTE